jgi:hypothetical protein
MLCTISATTVSQQWQLSQLVVYLLLCETVISQISSASLQPTLCCIWTSCRLDCQLSEVSISRFSASLPITSSRESTYKGLLVVSLIRNERMSVHTATTTALYISIHGCNTEPCRQFASRYICSAAWNVDYGISPELHSQGLVDRHAL